MEEEVKSLSDYLEVIIRRKYWALIPAVILIIFSASVIFLLPATYKSEGKILIESQEIPQDLIKSTVTSYADQRIEIIRQRILTTERMSELVKEFNLYPKSRDKMSISEILELFKENLEVKMINANVTDPRSGRLKKASIAFSISFLDKNPYTAKKVTNKLLTEFLAENVRTRSQRATETKEFLQEEGDKFQRKVQLLEKKIAEFKDEYSDSLPELLEYNLSMLTRLQDEIAENQNQIMTITDQILTLNVQLTGVPVYLEEAVTTNKTVKPNTLEQELHSLKSEYSRLSAKYSLSHPDVLQMKRQITHLETELGLSSEGVEPLKQELAQAEKELKELNQNYSNKHPDVKQLVLKIEKLKETINQKSDSSDSYHQDELSISTSDRQINPIYLQIKTRIDASEREIKRLRTRQAELKEKLSIFEERVVQTHQVKRAYDDLTRDHENNLQKYKELRAKQLEAELGENLESENKGESFVLLEPAQFSNRPEKPNRPKLLIVATILAIGVGCALALLVEYFKGGVRGYKQITRILGKEPLVVVPVIITKYDEAKRKSTRMSLLILLLILCVLSISFVHFFVVDLELLWYKVMRKVTLL